MAETFGPAHCAAVRALLTAAGAPFLLVELGEDLINDPKFYELVAEVESRMRAEPSLLKSIDDAAEMLLAQTN